MSKSKLPPWKKKEEPKKALTKLEQDVAKSNPDFVKWLKTRKTRKKEDLDAK